MKRTSSDRPGGDKGRFGDRDGGAKRHRNNDGYAEALAEGKFELRFLLPTKCAGAVIGRGGEKIKAIREKHAAQISLPTATGVNNPNERICTIVVLQESLAECLQDILVNLAEFKELKNKKEEMEFRILIHQSMAGAIIGRGGEKIKELREQTESNLKVFSECAPSSTDRVLLISAMQDKIPGVVKQLVDFMKDIPIKGATKPYDSANYDPRIAASYGGFPGQGQGSNSSFSGPPRNSGGRGNADPFDGGRGAFDSLRGQQSYGSQNSYGSQPGGYGGDFGGRPPYQSGGNSYPPSGGNSYGNGAPRGGPPQLGSAGYGSDVSTTQVTIPDELAGTIIGKGGERINRIRQDSGAKIDVGTTNYGTNERIITITGTAHQIQSAQYHLQQSVRTSEAGRRYLSQQQR